MRKLTGSLLLLLFFSPITEAGPLDWAKHHKRFLLMESAAITGASIHAAGLHHCRKMNGVEPCDEHYGEAWAMFGVTTGLSVVALPAIAEGCWKDQQGKFCYVFAYGGSTFQTGWGIHEWKIGGEHADGHHCKPQRLFWQLAQRDGHGRDCTNYYRGKRRMYLAR